MQNAFKLFGERDTESFDLYFKQSRIVLTSIYVFIVALILLFSGSITRFVFSQRINDRYERIQHAAQEHPDRIPPPPNALEVRQDLVETVLTVNLTLLMLAGLLSYWFAGTTLQPIRKAYHKQRRFLSDASHELRTPLAILQTNLENERDTAPSTEVRLQIESHLEEVARMRNLVQDLLIVSQLHRDTLPAQDSWKDVDIADALAHTVTRLSSIAAKSGIVLTVDNQSATPLLVQAPRAELLGHAFTNIIQNAILYNKENGIVEIELSANETHVQIQISDTGIGIPKEEIKSVFKRFYRGDKSRSRQSGGSGLGLSIVQSIIDALGGTVAMQSEPEKGTIVTISLPIHRAS
jgi:signal transduction histidine kinase